MINLVNKSKYLLEDEKVEDVILVFNTKKQHTWLVKTDNQLFYLLDDEKTRLSQTLIQKRVNLEDINTIKTDHESELSGIFDINDTDWWYYSLAELGMPRSAKKKLYAFVI